jgi:7-cyano-7-deazaguanine synthase
MGPNDPIVPNRNAILINVAVNYAIRCNADEVTLGCNKHDEAEFPDCRMAFIQLVNATLKTTEIKVCVKTPYIHKMKWEIGDLAREFGVTLESIWTCYRNGTDPCGQCPACLKLKLSGL